MATTKIVSGAGLKRIQIFALDENGYPSGDQTGSDGYDGVRMTGAKSASITIPDPTVITHTGDDVPFAQDYLAPQSLPTAAMTTGKTNLSLDATLANTKVETIADANMGVLATNVDGQEIDACAIFYRQAVDTDPDGSTGGARRWSQYIFPVTRIVPKGGSADQGSDDVNNYNLICTKSTKAPWGKTFNNTDHGATESAFMRVTSANPMMLERYDIDGGSVLDCQFTPVSTAKTAVYWDGTLQTVSSVDTSAKTITLDGTVTNASPTVAFYETSDNIG